MHDCRTCKHNTYIENRSITDWVSCSHPVTLAKGPRWERGDPAMVNYRTGDVPVSEIAAFEGCDTYQEYQR